MTAFSNFCFAERMIIDQLLYLGSKNNNPFRLQVDPSLVIYACIRLLVFFFLCLYEIFCFRMILTPYLSFSPSYNIHTLFFFICHILSFECLYYQIFFFRIIYTPHYAFYYSYNMQASVLFTCCIYASFIYALHVVFSFINPPDYIHSCTAFCLSLYILAKKPYAFLTFLSPWYLSRRTYKFIFRGYKEMSISHLADQYIRSSVWFI